MTDKSVLGDLPEGVASAMFLRDGWPDAVVCKVLMKSGCVGIGLLRMQGLDVMMGPQEADARALADALNHISATPPDYSEVLEHMANMQAKAALLAAETSGSA